MQNKIKVIVVTGPTATGKTGMAVRIARSCEGEIISVDSRQVYRGLDLGTGKDLAEYAAGGAPVLYHLIDVVDPGTEYHLARFCRDAAAALFDIAGRGRLPVCCGGTALYLDALLRGYDLPGDAPDPSLRAELQQLPLADLQQRLIDLDPAAFAAFREKGNPTRLFRAIEKILYPGLQIAEPVADRIEPLVLAPYYPRAEVHRRIEIRLDDRLRSGMIEEVEQLHRNGLSWERLEWFGLEYRFLAQYLQGKMSRQEMRDQLLIKIRQFARRQDIWFRKMEREGLNIYWIDRGELEPALPLIRDFLAGRELPLPERRLMNLHYGPVSSQPGDGCD